MGRIICSHCCQESEIYEALQKVENVGIQIRGECWTCRRWIKWVPYKDSYLVKNILFAFYRREGLEKILKDTVIYNQCDKEIQ